MNKLNRKESNRRHVEGRGRQEPPFAQAFPKSLRGQAPLISHALVIGFSLIVLLVVIMSLNYLEDEYRQFVGENEIQQLCGIIKYSTEKIYNPTNYTSPTVSTMGKITLSLPNRIAGMTYRARFMDDSVYITTLTEPIIDTTCNININATFSGTTKGGETEITWTTYPDRQEITMEAINV